MNKEPKWVVGRIITDLWCREAREGEDLTYFTWLRKNDKTTKK